MRGELWLRLLLILLCLLPLLVLFFLPGEPAFIGGLWFWPLLLLTLLVIWLLLGARRSQAIETAEPEIRMLHPEQQPEVVKDVMQVDVALEKGPVRVFRGRLRESPETAYQKLRHAYAPTLVPLLQKDEELETSLVLMPISVEQAVMEQPVRPWIHWLLFGLTLLTTTWAGAAHQGVNLLRDPGQFAVGLPYALGLMGILGLHELGHYFTARYHGMRVTPPYFIPVPFALGTFGAFIQMKSPSENRRMLFDVAVAGPLAGLVVAVPALLLGLQQSVVLVGNDELARRTGLISLEGTSVGSSVLLALLARLALPEALEYGCTIRFSPLAFAGWLGLIVTALNLMPIGQLDGGHMARAMFGTRIGEVIGSIAMWSLFLLALFVWPALLLFAIIVFFIAGRGAPPLNDLTPLTRGRLWLGWFTFAILVLILMPVPPGWLEHAGIYCPYL